MPPAYLNTLARLGLGDRNALRDLMAFEQDFVADVSRRLLRPPLAGVLETEDVVQDVAICVLRNRRRLKFNSRSQVRAWLGRVVQNRVTDLHRRHFKTSRRIPFTRSLDATPSRTSWSRAGPLGAQLPMSGPGPSSIARNGEDRLRLQRALLRMREEYRTLIERVCFQHQPLAEIAAQEGRSPGSVRMQFQRALAACRQAFEDLDREARRESRTP